MPHNDIIVVLNHDIPAFYSQPLEQSGLTSTMMFAHPSDALYDNDSFFDNNYPLVPSPNGNVRRVEVQAHNRRFSGEKLESQLRTICESRRR